MPCNLAVSIAKASVTSAQLVALLTPDTVTKLLTAHMAVTKRTVSGVTTTASGALAVFPDGTRCDISHGTIRVTTPPYAGAKERALAQVLLDELTTLIAAAADQLFAIHAAKALGRLGPVSQRTVTVENAGTTQTAVLLQLEL